MKQIHLLEMLQPIHQQLHVPLCLLPFNLCLQNLIPPLRSNLAKFQIDPPAVSFLLRRVL